MSGWLAMIPFVERRSSVMNLSTSSFFVGGDSIESSATHYLSLSGRV